MGVELNGIAHIQLTVNDVSVSKPFWKPLLDLFEMKPLIDTDTYYYAIGSRTGIAISEAIETARKARPQLILLDINMPGLDGYSACKKIKSGQSGQVVMLTSKDGLFDKAKGRIVGSDQYITKPFSKEELLGTIKDLCAVRAS